MFVLEDKNNKAVQMKNGTPFTYSSHQLAKLGKKFLELDRKESYKIVRIY